MSEPLRGVVVCHGPLAKALTEAVAQISGLDDALIAVSNSGCDREALEERVVQAVANQPAVVFVDMASGSCVLAVFKRLRGLDFVRVVTGVNLAMLVDFVFHRDLSPADAAARAATAGGNAIRVS